MLTPTWAEYAVTWSAGREFLSVAPSLIPYPRDGLLPWSSKDNVQVL